MLKRNLAANLIGTIWSGVAAFALVPVYVRFAGIEAYGLVAFQATLQALLLLLDAGFSTAVNREIAVLSAGRESASEVRTIIRSAGVFYWAVAAAAGLVLAASAPLIATRWLHAEHLAPQTMTTAVRLMAAALAFQFPYSLYSGAMLGLQRHVALNAVLVTATTVRAVGGIAIIAVSHDIVLFFAWQVVGALLQTAGAAIALHRALPPAPSRFDPASLRRTRAFAGGMALITVLAAAETQIDKLTVSKLLPLETFGAYGVAASLAAVLVMIAVPVGVSAFPRFSQLAAAGASSELALAYRHASQVVAVMVLPAAFVLAFFAREIVFVWTGNAALAATARPIVVFLVLGSACNGLVNIPYMVQLAYGWTLPAIVLNALAIAVLLPLLPVAVRAFGAPGAAATWLAVNLVFLVTGIILTHRRLLHGAQ